MTNRDPRWRILTSEEPLSSGPLDWDRWVRRRALTAAGSIAPASGSAAGISPCAAASMPNAQVSCFRTRITANLDRLIEELFQEAERLNRDSAEVAFATDSP